MSLSFDITCSFPVRCAFLEGEIESFCKCLLTLEENIDF